MEKILDNNYKKTKNTSWKPVLITNGVLVFLCLCYFIPFISSDSIQVGLLGKEQVLFPLLFIFSFSIFIINIFLALVSSLLSNGYSRKWLKISVYAVLTSIIILIISVIILYN